MNLSKPPELAVAALALALTLGGAVGLAHQRETAAATTDAAGGTDVAIKGYTFGPKALTVSVGDTVTWSQGDGTKHTVTGKDASKAVLDSEYLEMGATYKVTFDEAGSYSYFCVFHPNMQGTITVEG